MELSRYKRNVIFWIGTALSVLIFLRQDSMVWRGIIFVYLILFACGAVLTRLQNRGTVKFVPRELLSPRVAEWFKSSFYILILVYLIVYSPDNAFDVYHSDVFMYGITAVVALLFFRKLAEGRYFDAGGYFVVVVWLAMFLLLHWVYISEATAALVVGMYYMMMGLSIIVLLWRIFVAFPSDESVVAIAMVCFALKEIYVEQILPNVDSGIDFFSNIPWINQ